MQAWQLQAIAVAQCCDAVPVCHRPQYAVGSASSLCVLIGIKCQTTLMHSLRLACTSRKGSREPMQCRLGSGRMPDGKQSGNGAPKVPPAKLMTKLPRPSACPPQRPSSSCWVTCVHAGTDLRADKDTAVHSKSCSLEACGSVARLHACCCATAWLPCPCQMT